MTLKRWIGRMFGRTPVDTDKRTRILLDAVDRHQIDRLSRLTGRSPQQVRQEAEERALKQMRRVQQLGRH